MTTTPISTFTVPVTFRGIAYDVEITPLLNGSPLPLFPDRIKQWNEAEKTHQLFSRKIGEMLQNVKVRVDPSTLLITGSKDGFKFADNTQTVHETAALWGEFIDCLKDPASHTAGKPKVDDEEESVLGREIGPGAMLRFTDNVYLSLSPEKQKKTQFNVFKKKCVQFYCAHYGVRPTEPITFNDAEEACIKVLLNPDMEPSQMRLSLWVQQNKATRDEWALASYEIKKEIEAAAKPASPEAPIAAADDESSDIDLL